MTHTSTNAIDRWHEMMAAGSTDGLYDLLAPECVFWSPVVHTPQQGRDITYLYLSAAGQVFNTDFRYVRDCLLYTSPSPRDLSTPRMPSSA